MNPANLALPTRTSLPTDPNQVHPRKSPARFGRLLALVLLFLLIPVQPSPAASEPVFDVYIKDSRDLDEIGLVCTLEASAKPGGKVYIRITTANPALCGSTLEWETSLRDNLAVIDEGNCRLNIGFFKDRVTVEGAQCQPEACTLSGTYYPYGTLSKPVPEAIEDIRRHYAYINENLENWDVDEKELVGFSTEGGSFKTYSYMDYPKKIIVEHFGETGRLMEEYYFFDGHLLFCFRQTVRYDRPLGKVVETAEDRFYFNQGQMIRWLNHEKKEVPASDQAYQAEAEKLILSAGRYISLAQSGQKVVEKSKLGDL